MSEEKFGAQGSQNTHINGFSALITFVLIESKEEKYSIKCQCIYCNQCKCIRFPFM